MIRFRFTIAQLMILIAIAVLILANLLFLAVDSYLQMIPYLVDLAEVAVLLSYVRLSRWMRLAAAGSAGTTLSGLLMMLVMPNVPGPQFDEIYTLHLLLSAAFSLLFVVGIAQTFGDITRRLSSSSVEGELSLEGDVKNP
jgi:hypothetical protein